MHAFSGIRTRDPRNLEAAELHGHLNRLTYSFYFPIIQQTYFLLVTGPNSAEHWISAIRCFQSFAAIRFFCNNAADFIFVLPVSCGANPITGSTFRHLAFATQSRCMARGHKIVAPVFGKQVQTAKYRQSRITWTALIVFCFTPRDWLKKKVQRLNLSCTRHKDVWGEKGNSSLRS